MKMIFSYLLVLIAFCKLATSSSISLAIEKSIISRANASLADGYVFTPGVGAHKFHITPKDWNEARNTCIDEGAHLAVISSTEEELLILTKKIENKLDSLWLGVHDQFKRGDYVTVSDARLSAVGHVHWKSGEPLSTNNESCAAYTTIADIGMALHSCSTKHPFVCKMDFN